jgi:hypothetical protein
VRAREDDPEDFERARRAWPSGFADSRKDAFDAWGMLTPNEQAEAFAEIGRFTDATKAVGRKHFCTLASYLRERRWKALPPRPAALVPGMRNDPPKTPPKPARPTAFQQARPELFGLHDRRHEGSGQR